MKAWRVIRFLFLEFMVPAAVLGSIVSLATALIAGFGYPHSEAAEPFAWLMRNNRWVILSCTLAAIGRIVYRAFTGYYESGGELGRF
jgi:hypothetical protein